MRNAGIAGAEVVDCDPHSEFADGAKLRGGPLEVRDEDGLSHFKRQVAGLTNVSGRSLFQLVRDLAQHLGVWTVAEGIESEEQLIILRDLGCTALQGFFFSTPLSPDALLAWARTETRTQAA